MDEKLAALAGLDLFDGLSKKHLELIGRVTDRIEVTADHVLIRQGQVTTHMAVLITGSVTVTVDDEVVATLGSGEVIGELSMIDGAPATATVTTAEPSTIWLIARSGFIPVWEDNPEMSQPMLVAVTRRLRSMDEHLHS